MISWVLAHINMCIKIIVWFKLNTKSTIMLSYIWNWLKLLPIVVDFFINYYSWWNKYQLVDLFQIKLRFWIILLLIDSKTVLCKERGGVICFLHSRVEKVGNNTFKNTYTYCTWLLNGKMLFVCNSGISERTLVLKP